MGAASEKNRFRGLDIEKSMRILHIRKAGDAHPVATSQGNDTMIQSTSNTALDKLPCFERDGRPGETRDQYEDRIIAEAKAFRKSLLPECPPDSFRLGWAVYKIPPAPAY